VSSRKSAVSNAGPLIHLSKAHLLDLLKGYNTVIPFTVKIEVVDKGKEKGFGDAFIVEQAIEEGWLEVIEIKANKRFVKTANIAGLHEAEMLVVYYAYKHDVLAFLDDEAARVFARELGVNVRGSLGLLVEGVKEGRVSYSEGLRGLENLAEIMYLSANVYRLTLKMLGKVK
jgi:predicted nucleic acid-binding protein